MAISVFFGRTESGKSFRANIESKRYDKAFIYDNTHCFEDGVIITDFSQKNLIKIFEKYALKEKFRLIFRPPFTMDERHGAEIVAQLLYKVFGVFWKKKNIDFSKFENRVCFLVDEADKVSGLKKDSIFYLVVTKGRHFGIDTFGISQGPGKIPSYYKENASEVFSFKMPSHEYLIEVFGRKIAEKIPTLRIDITFILKTQAKLIYLMIRVRVMDDSNNRFFLIPKYENYAFDPKRIVVINLKNKKTLKPLKCTGVISFKLFKNGIPVTVTLFDIFKGVIEKYFNPKKI